MVPPKSLREQFSFTQQDMAILLGVTRAYYAMFEIGKRNLPPAAVQRYTGLASQIFPPGATKKSIRPVDDQKRSDPITRLLRENEYQRKKLTIQIAILEKKQTRAIHLSLLSAFL